MSNQCVGLYHWVITRKYFHGSTVLPTRMRRGLLERVRANTAGAKGLTDVILIIHCICYMNKVIKRAEAEDPINTFVINGTFVVKYETLKDTARLS